MVVKLLPRRLSAGSVLFFVAASPNFQVNNCMGVGTKLKQVEFAWLARSVYCTKAGPMNIKIGLQGDSTLRVPEHVLSRRAVGETVLLNLDNEQYYGLDALGTRVWQLLETGITFGQAMTTLLGEFEVDRDVLAADLTELIRTLASSGLVVINGT